MKKKQVTQRRDMIKAMKQVESYLETMKDKPDNAKTIDIGSWTDDMKEAFILLIDPKTVSEKTDHMKNIWAKGKRLEFKIIE